MIFKYILLWCWTMYIAEGLYINGQKNSYARFPKWNACKNASLEFEFVTSQASGLLMYTDDGGSNDYMELSLQGGKLRLRMKLVVDELSPMVMTVGKNLNDNRWHRVIITRNRMETQLRVTDVLTWQRRTSIGSDFNFGDPTLRRNSHVYFGGLPRTVLDNLRQLALPSVMTENPVFKGSLRNVIYSNCSCFTTRAVMEAGQGISRTPLESCERRVKPCDRGCVCRSEDSSDKCDCADSSCSAGTITHYHLPMDYMESPRLVNPSGLEAKMVGTPSLRNDAVIDKALKLNKGQYVVVSGPGHRDECFGDLDKCHGYTLALWAKFVTNNRYEEGVYISNGGHSTTSHGIAMLYKMGQLTFKFRLKNGNEWSVMSKLILPYRWYHIAATWSPAHGLVLYINGHRVDRDTQIQTRGQDVSSGPPGKNDFVIGRPNDAQGRGIAKSFYVDELHFWSMYMTQAEIRENGPIFFVGTSMDSISPSGLVATSTGYDVTSRGAQPTVVPGKMGSALKLTGNAQYLSLGDLSETCVGDIQRCQIGLYMSAWIRFDEIHDMSIFSSGEHGFHLEYQYGQLKGTFNSYADSGSSNSVLKTKKSWTVRWNQVPEKGRWYFVELSWNPSSGLFLFVNLNQIDSSNSQTLSGQTFAQQEAYVGRSQGALSANRMTIDDLSIWYADRETLERLDFIKRSRPTLYFLNMDTMEPMDGGQGIRGSDINLELRGQPKIIPGKIHGALSMNGINTYASTSSPMNSQCIANLDRCMHGSLIAMWIRPGKAGNQMHYISTGQNGIEMYHDRGTLKITAMTTTQQWELSTHGLTADKWYFLELSWDDMGGLKLYLDNNLVASSSGPTPRVLAGFRYDRNLNKVQLGKKNGVTYNYGNMTVDEFEYWEANRDFLMAFGYIYRARPPGLHIDFDDMRNNHILHPSLKIKANGNPVLVDGKIRKAVRLNGAGQYVDVGKHPHDCFGNIALCHNGITLSTWINFRRLEDDMYFLSSGQNGYRIYSKNGRVFVEVQLDNKKWSVAVNGIDLNKWYYLEFSWSKTTGLSVFLDNKLVGHQQTSGFVTPADDIPQGNLYIGRANPGDAISWKYGDALFDDMDIVYGRRDVLLVFDYILRGNFDMETISWESKVGNKVQHPRLDITAFNGASIKKGQVGNAIFLNGRNQYADLGDLRNACMGNLEKCRHGITVSFFIQPNSLQGNQYFLSSAAYDVFTQNGRLHAKFKTPTRTWEVSSSAISPNIWNLVDLTWFPDRGLEMYINNIPVDSRKIPEEHTAKTVTDYNVYVGKPGRDITGGSYASGAIDELQYYYAPRDILVAWDVLLRDNIPRDIYDMNIINGDFLVHPSKIVHVGNRPRTVPGVEKQAVFLESIKKQYIDLGGNVTCDGSLLNCYQGFMLRFRIQPKDLKDDMYFMDSNPIKVYWKNNRLWAVFNTPYQTYTTTTDAISKDKWNLVDLSWDRENGLVFYVNNKKVAQQMIPRGRIENDDLTKKFYIGQANEGYFQYMDGYIDDMQFWNAKRDYLIYKGLIDVSIKPDKPIGPKIEVTYPKDPTIDDRWYTIYVDELPPGLFRPSNLENITLSVKVEQPDGLLWYTGTDNQNFRVYLENGIVVIESRYPDGSSQKFNLRELGRLSLNELHKIRIQRNGRTVQIFVDDKGSRPYDFNQVIRFIDKGQISVGGGLDMKGITGTIDYVNINGNRYPISIDLLKLLNVKRLPNHIGIENVVIRIDGKIITYPDTRPRQTSITFLREDAHVALRKWKVGTAGSISLRFRTVEPNGLLLFNPGEAGRPHFFAVELYDGKLHAVAEAGSGGAKRVMFSDKIISDGRPHDVKITRHSGGFMLELDTERKQFVVPGIFQLGDSLYVGGTNKPRQQWPWKIWSRTGFMGCVENLFINKRQTDFARYMPRFAAGIVNGCSQIPQHCRLLGSVPCRNGGICSDRWNSHHCDCSKTDFVGRFCERVAPQGNFNGRNWVDIVFVPPSSQHVNDISFRFKTSTPDGAIFMTSNDRDNTYMKLGLEKGQLVLRTNLGGASKVLRAGAQLNDNRWHTVYIKRRADHIQINVDNQAPAIDDLPGENYRLEMSRLHVAYNGPRRQTDKRFTGIIKNFYIDGQVVTKLPEEFLPTDPVTFYTADSYLQLPTFRVNERDANFLSFAFKTKSDEGTLLYNAGRQNEFIALELVKGHVQFSFSNRNGVTFMKARSSRPLNDNEWHQVRITRPNEGQYVIKIDDFPEERVTIVDDRFDLTGGLYIGGVPKNVRLPAHLEAKRGFQGCIASVELNSRPSNILREAVNSHINVASGCHELLCQPDTCQNFGVCHQSLNRIWCDCNMTGYWGRACTELPHPGYWFNKDAPSVLVHHISPPVDTDTDELAFGVMTWADNGIIFRADSYDKNDFLEARMENGYLVVRYDLGNGIRTIKEERKRLNDGRYHVVRFVRNGEHGELRIDGMDARVLDFPGSRDNVFNQLNILRVGGNHDSEGNIIDYYDGLIAGLYYNGKRIFDLKPPDVIIDGVVEVPYPWPQPWPNNPRPCRPGESALRHNCKAGKPTGPSQVDIRRITENSMDIVWGAPRNNGGSSVTRYVLYVFNTKTGRWERLTSVGHRTRLYTLTGLEQGVGYCVRIIAVNSIGESVPASPSGCNYKVRLPPKTVPSPPLSPQVLRVNSDKADVSWFTPINNGRTVITGYIIELSDDGRTFSERGRVNGNVLTYKIENISPDSQYWFRVIAINEVGRSRPSTSPTFRTNKRVTVPDPPKNYQLTGQTLNSFTFIWEKPDNNGGARISRYEIEKRDERSSTWQKVGNTRRGTRQYTMSNLSPNELLFIRIYAVNKVGRSSPLESDQPHGPRKPIKTRPSPPQNLIVAGKTPKTISIGWDPPAADGNSPVTKYRIYYRTVGGAYSSQVGEVVVGRPRTYRITGLVKGTNYIVGATAVNAIGESDKASTGVVNVPSGPPDRPRNLRITNVNHRGFVFNWDQPQSDGGSPIIAYIIDYREGDKPDGWTLAGRVSSSVRRLDISNLKPNFPYYVRIIATNKNGPSPYAETSQPVFTKTPPGTVPGTPENFKVIDKTTDTIYTIWSPPLFDGGSRILGYLLMIRDDETTSWKPVQNVTSSTLTYTFTGLTKDKCYLLRVYARNAFGLSRIPAEELSRICLTPTINVPSRPQRFRISSVRDKSIIVDWDVPGYDGGSPILNYTVWYRVFQQDLWTQAAVVDKNIYRHELTNMQQNVPFFIRVTAHNIKGSSLPSQIGPIQIIPSRRIPPTPPRDLVAYDTGDDYIAIRWNEPSYQGSSAILRYIVEYRHNGSSNWIRSNTVPGDVRIYRIGGLDDKKYYFIRVFAENAENRSAPAIPLQPVYVGTKLLVPGAPQNPTVVDIENNYLDIHWDKPITDGGSSIIEYIIQYREADESAWREAGRVGDTIYDYRLTGLTGGSDYFVRVFSRNKIGTSSGAGVIGSPIQTNIGNIPSAPTNMVISDITHKSFLVTWRAPSDTGGSEIINYVVERMRQKDGKWVVAGTVIGGVNEYVVDGLDKSEYYWVRVGAINRYGTGPWAKNDKVVVTTPGVLAPVIKGGTGAEAPIGGNAGPVAAAVGSGAGGAVALGSTVGAVAGALAGVLLLAGSLIWAFYRCKPGWLPCGGAGGKGVGAGKGKYAPVPSNGASSAGGSAAFGAGGITGTDGKFSRADHAMSMYDAPAAHIEDHELAALSGMSGGGAGYGAGGAGYGAGGAGYGAGEQGYMSETMQSSMYTSGGTYGGGAYGAGGTGTLGGAGYNTAGRAYSVSSAGGSQAGRGYNTLGGASALHDEQYGTMQSSYNFESAGQQGAGGGGMQLMGVGTATGLPVPFLTLSEEVKVDHFLISQNGRQVVTGSSCGPPQVWDMTNGELIRIMKGDDLASTDIHLALGDAVLVGQVSSDSLHIDMNEIQAGNHIPHRQIQVWDFESGRPLDIGSEPLLCTASAVMKDGQRVILGCTEKFGNSTSVFIFDLVSNDIVREMRYDGAIGIADSIKCLHLSPDNRYVVAGFHNSYDGNANFIVFDLSQAHNIVEPKILALDAEPECTVVLDNHEAITGTRKGELTVWSLKTGKALRQLITSGAGNTMTLGRTGVSSTVAHTREVKQVVLSKDGRYLVSASCDGTLKVWNMETEKLEHTLRGHSDEVWCAAISKDDDWIVSGSRDCTIRLWRLRSGKELCAFNTGIDIFSVQISNDKKTIVALGDKFSSRKLIMLQVVHTKTKRNH